MDRIEPGEQRNSDMVAMDIVGELIRLDAANFDRDTTTVDADFVRVGSHPCLDAGTMQRVNKHLEDRAAISIIPSRDLVAMRRITRLLVAALFVGLCTPAYVVWDKTLKPSSVSVSSERSKRIDDLVEDANLNLRAREGTVLVIVVAEDGTEGKCAGIILNNRTIVLPKHAFEKDGRKFALKGIETGDFRHNGAEVVRSGSKCVWDQENENPYVLVEDPDTDVVVMRFGRPIEGVDEDRALPLADGKPGYGKEVLAIGHPGAVSWQAAYGFVDNDTGLPDELSHSLPDYMVLNLPAVPGNSGGPVVNEYGWCLGILSAAHGVVKPGMSAVAVVLTKEFIDKLVEIADEKLKSVRSKEQGARLRARWKKRSRVI